MARGRGARQRTLLVREPFEVDPEAEIVRAVAEAAGGAAAGIPTVMYGAGGPARTPPWNG